MSVTIHTSLGDLKLELNCTELPKVCYNFLALAASGYYNGSLFHRNIKGFMLQGGAPAGSGGKGGDSIWGGQFEDHFNSHLKHNKRGIVSMANKGPNTNASQFFITYASAPHLDNVYTVFGQVLSGFETLDAMEKVPVGRKHRPVEEIVIESITIHANPLAVQDPIL
uniref:Peptidyl-prolyl cis-trans isomerase n=1 Tax=Aplanochytrium stocchinoi TaxID=215587 RepID=A0A6S8EAL6_9STRA|mmetsp:Transcript_6333/g.7989  ORF Transcript_6333/g.7989 Transcript_6333/m.7989 type:complete len:167 (+) Transcript_6333:175-675(+)|eukprot:CAMPEP_0204841322 /NCGR_PEP_ID=MMETSP1346-20131115/41389_1 /ASSEMBLY_ACC=CAM_ASM_000771 /TAXON_ID=215587 /ORGANISM="Aplanochytrium stocchinoi, Strain GSBS06" /LENGTH=166 /DNA_ID=CAMNT_0051979357 /DNA_START=155 /DNA_END=658 /DNA_ORIENTATION=-